MRWISPKHNEELKRRSAHAILRDRLPEDWAAMIAELPLAIRPMVGRIVWWDWFSERLVPHRWHHLDQYLNVNYIIQHINFYKHDPPTTIKKQGC